MGGSFDTWSLIRTDVLDRAEEETGASVSEFYAFVARAGDRAYSYLQNKHAFLFTRNKNPLMLQVFGPITTTITWTVGAYTATLGAAVARNLRGWKVKVAASNFGYRIVTHEPNTTGITLDVPLIATANLTGASATLYRDEYDLAQLQDTPTAPAVGVGATGLPSGTYKYGCSFFNENGETELGDLVTGVVLTLQQGSISSIPIGPPGTLGRYVYRNVNGGSVMYLVATVNDNITTTATDNVADSALTANQQPSEINMTGGVRHIIGMWTKGHSIEIDGPFTEAWVSDHYPDPPTASWPPYGYCRRTDVRIRFTQYPSEDGVIEIPHTVIQKDLSQTVGIADIAVPRNWRYVLSDLTLWHLLDMKHDDRAIKWMQTAGVGVNDMIADDDIKRIGLEGTRNRTREEPAY